MSRGKTAPPHLADRPPADLDAIVESFEDECAHGGAVDLNRFLPDRGDPNFCAIAVELIRVDLEYSWRDGRRNRLEAYRQIAPEVFDQPALLEGAAFEEFRLRRLAGENAAARDYALRFGVAVENWPLISPVSHDHRQGYRSAGSEFPRIGDRLGEFTLVSEIGRGAFATVFLAEQADLAKRPVVLKITATRSLESQHLARLQHTNIVPIYSMHDWHGLLAVCMPYFGNRTLADVMNALRADDALPPSGRALLSTVGGIRDETVATNTELPQRELARAANSVQALGPSGQDDRLQRGYVDFVLSVVEEIGAGLDHAHRRGIVHRDVKPANILMTDEGRPMLLDFNLSDELVVNGAQSLAVGGTLPYMAPEHLRAVRLGGTIDARGDVYSLGVIMYQLLSGHLPYPTRDGTLDDVLEAMLRDRTGRLPSLRQHNRQVSPAVEAIVQKCLEPELGDRYKSAAHFVEDVRRHREHLPLKVAANTSVRERLSKWCMRHPHITSWSSLTAASVALTLVFVALWVGRSRYIARLEADQRYANFVDSLPAARMAASVPNSEGPLIARGIDAIDNVLKKYDLPSDEDWQERPAYANLPPARRRELNDQLAEVAYLAARGEANLARLADDQSKARRHLQAALRFNQLAGKARAANGSSAAIFEQRDNLLSALNLPHEASQETSPTVDGPLEQLLQTQQLLDERDFAGSLPLLEDLRKHQPIDPVVWLLIGNAYAGLGRFHDADGCYTTAIVLQPGSYVAYLNRALCRTQLAEYQLALEDFDTVLAQRSDLQCVRLNRVQTYEQAGDLPRALADLDTAIAGGDVPARAYFLRSRIRARLGDAQGAKQDLVLGLAKRPIDDVDWVARGYARLNDDPEGALSDFRRALALNPRSKLALKNVVHVTADRLAFTDEAQQALDTLIELDPSNASALAGRAVMYARMKRRDDALADLDRALRMSQEPLILFQGACCLSLTSAADDRDAVRGLALLNRAIELKPPLIHRAMSDPDLQSLRKLPDYEALTTKLTELNQIKRKMALSGNERGE